MFTNCTTYRGRKLREIAFPLGGIGTGTVSLTGSGALAEWQVRNRPDQDSLNEHTFFCLWARRRGGEPVCRVLEGPVAVPYSRHQRSVHGSHFPGGGLGNSGVFGLPHVESVTFHGAYPFAAIDYHDRALPLQVRLEAYNPMIPMEPDDSGIPCAIFRFHVHNASRQPVDLTLAMSMRNLCAERSGRNRFVRHGALAGLHFDNPEADRNRPDSGTMAIVTPWKRLTWRTAWYRLDWFNPLQSTWDEFSATGRLADNRYADAPRRRPDAGTLGLRASLGPGESAVLPLWVTWSFRLYEFPFGEADAAGSAAAVVRKPTWRNWYARRFPTAMSVARYLQRHEERLYQTTRRFREDLESSTVDPRVLHAVSSQMSILRSPTCLRLEDGSFYAFEGSHQTQGSCPGSCTHVWNYAQALAYLYPSLQQSLHTRNYRYNFSPSGSGAMAFRIPCPPHAPRRPPIPAVDGQMGELVRIYQAWKLTGDTAWLRSLWPDMKRSLEFAWKHWDWRKRGVVEGIAHNTYDIDFYGPNGYSSAYYLAALEACSRIALYMGETDKAGVYRRLAQAGSRWADKHLWNGEYYVQRIDPDAWKHSEVPRRKPVREVPAMKPGEPKYQYGTGCLADQLTGQWLGRLAGLGLQLDAGHVSKALHSVFRNNFRSSLSRHANCQRAFALQDEAALLLCTWPRGGRPVLPFIYCDEAWTGVEYAVASHLLLEGRQREAMAIVSAIERRHDGERRNPWNQFEAGSYYARALSSWALLVAASGFECDGVAGMVGFRVRGSQGSYFWSAQKAWGVLRWKPGTVALRVDHGVLKLSELRLAGLRPAGAVRVSGRRLSASVEGSVVRLARRATLRQGDELTVA